MRRVPVNLTEAVKRYSSAIDDCLSELAAGLPLERRMIYERGVRSTLVERWTELIGAAEEVDRKLQELYERLADRA